MTRRSGRKFRTNDLANLVFSNFERTVKLSDFPKSLGAPLGGFIDIEHGTFDFRSGEVAVVQTRSLRESRAAIFSLIMKTGQRSKQSIVVLVPEEADDFALSLVASVGRIDQERLACGCLEDAEWPRLTETVERFRNFQVQIGSSRSLPERSLEFVKFELLTEEKSVEMLIVDRDCLALQEELKFQPHLDGASGLIERLQRVANRLQCPIVIFEIIEGSSPLGLISESTPPARTINIYPPNRR